MKSVWIQCSCCGNHTSFSYTVTNVMKQIKEGWNSFGSALYCPICSKTWNERNKGIEMHGQWNTIRIIDERYDNQHKRR
jgi:hypothetical protein